MSLNENPLLSDDLENVEVRVLLIINDRTVANAKSEDAESPSSLSLRYQGRIEMNSFVEVVISGAIGRFNIPAKALQWGYKIYGPEYNLLEDVNRDCV